MAIEFTTISSFDGKIISQVWYSYLLGYSCKVTLWRDMGNIAGSFSTALNI